MQSEPLRLADIGYRVFPCAESEKRPLPASGLKAATSDADQVEAWSKQYPGCNWAIECTGLLVIDVDGADNPWPQDADQALDLAVAPISLTPNGGRHFLFRC